MHGGYKTPNSYLTNAHPNILDVMPCDAMPCTVNSNDPFEAALAHSPYWTVFGSHKNSITSSVVSPLFQSALYT